MQISSECIEQFKAHRNKAEYLHGTLHDFDYENKWRLWARLQEAEARGAEAAVSPSCLESTLMKATLPGFEKRKWERKVER